MKLRFSLKTAWYTLILMVGLVPLAIVLSWATLNQYEQLLNNALTKEQHYNEEIKIHLTHEIKRLITLLENKSDPMAYTLAHNHDKNLLNELLSKAISREKSVHILMILKPDGDIIAAMENHDSVIGEPIEPDELRNYWQQENTYIAPEMTVPMQGKIYLDGLTQKHEEGLFFKLSVPIGPHQNPLAVLFANIDVRIFWEDIKDYFTRPEVRTYLVDSQGTLLNVPHETSLHTGQKIAELDIVNAFLGNKKWNQKQVYNGIDNKPVFGTLTPINNMGWGIVSEVEKEKITHSIYNVLTKLGSIILIILLLFIWVGFVLVKRIASPITAISRDFERVGKQDFSPTQLTSPLHEIQSLVSGFNQMTKKIGDSQEKLLQAAVVFESTAEGVVITNTNQEIIAINNAFTQITGYMESDVLGKKASVLKSGRHDANFFEQMNKHIEQFGEWQGEIWNRRKSGETFPELLTINKVENSQGEITHYVGVFTDITAIKQSEDQLAYLAHHDPLTGLANRLLLNSNLEQIIKRAQNKDKQVAVLFLDLDRFKNINDSMGHPQGDRLLEVVAKRLTSNIRDMDMISRLGGDEFVIVADNLEHVSDAAQIAESTLTSLNNPFQISGHEIFVNASIGISVFPKDGKDVETLIKNADAAMYRAKEKGRNNFQFYTEELTAVAFEKMSLETSLRHALDKNEFILHYQPQISLQTGRLVGMEALIRWQHPERGMVSPAKFIPIAEETGLIVPIGEWVLRTACKQNQQWIENGLPPVSVAVNLSARQFHSKGLTDLVSQTLESTGLDAQHLELELTESLMMQDADLSIKIMEEFDRMGVKLSIDDFGTGYSSLSHMKHFPIDKLKIDQSFVHDIGTNRDDKEIVVSIIMLGHSMNLNVIAEGVETKEQLDYLREHHCDEIQGYYYSRPVPADEFETFFTKQFESPVKPGSKNQKFKLHTLRPK